jgi:hypothetical protein
MQLSARFAEYGVTGAFFGIGQFVIFITWSSLTGVPLSLPAGITSLLERVPATLQPSANNFIGILGIIGIFVAGLLLDLFGSLLIMWEMDIFRKHLKRNQEWLKEIVEKDAVYTAEDYKKFVKVGGGFDKREWRAAFDMFIFWNRKRRKSFIDSLKRLFDRFRLIKSYNRLWTFFSSFAAVLPGSSQVGIFIDQMYLWRTSRAIATAMIIFSFEIVLMPYILMAQPNSIFGNYPSSIGWFLAIQIILMSISVLITYLAYSRMCYTLFSLVYLTSEKLENK